LNRAVRERWRWLYALGLAAAWGSALATVERLQLAWPTPNTAFLEGKPIETWAQPTVSGDPLSGLFGCTRNDGNRFHEGIDLLPLRHDARGESVDPVFAAMAGVVRHVSHRAADSSYGRYIVLEHPGATPAVYTLYAHLRSIAPGIEPGAVVTRGQTIGVLGRSAGGYTIPKERAHLHFEIGLRLSDGFQRWFDSRRFTSPNRHGNYNGMNLMGFDPQDFFDAFRQRRVDNVVDYLAQLTPAVRLRVARSSVPDFAERYPSLVRGRWSPNGQLGGWEIACWWTGLPLELRPLTRGEVSGLAPGSIELIAVDRTQVEQFRCVRLVTPLGNGFTAARELEDLVARLFGPE
jgi:murein DD-endopeptidase MepM/ murein hydrolase activator NlpD